MPFSMENEIKKNSKLLFSMILVVFLIALGAQQTVAADTSLQSPQVPNNLRVIDTGGDGDVGLPQDETKEAIEYTYYVHAGIGDDSHPGSKEKPFRTIQKAADVVEPGDRVLIRERVYKGFITIKASGAEHNLVKALILIRHS